MPAGRSELRGIDGEAVKAEPLRSTGPPLNVPKNGTDRDPQKGKTKKCEDPNKKEILVGIQKIKGRSGTNHCDLDPEIKDFLALVVPCPRLFSKVVLKAL